MQVHKIKQYNVASLIRIVLYKTVYKTRCMFDECTLKLRCSRRRYDSLMNGGGYKGDYQRVISSCLNFFNFVCIDSHIVKEAERIIKGNVTIFDTSFPFDYRTDWLKDPVSGNFWPNEFWQNARFVKDDCADVKYVLEINKLNHLVTLAQAFYITHDETFVANIKEQLNAWVKCVPAEMSVANKIVMDLGFRTINLVMISLLCGDSEIFRSEVHPQVLGILNQHSHHLWRFLSSRWFKSGNDNNHNIGEIVGLYVAQLWLKQFGIKTQERLINKEMKYLKRDLDKLIAPSGAYLEMSSNYARVVHDFLLIFELFRHSLDYNRNFREFDRNAYFERLSNYLICISYDGKIPNFGDNDFAQVALPFNRKDDVIGHVRIHFRKEPELKDYIDASQWVYRSHDSNQIFLFTRVGKFAYFVEGAFAHSHNDILSVLVGVKGHELFIDKGCIFYNSGIDIRKEFSSTVAHNNVSVDKIEMSDYLPIGYSHYPFSEVVHNDNSKCSCDFKGVLRYKDIVQDRNIVYKENMISITDNISVESSEERNVQISYLLAEGLIAEKKNDVVWVSLSNGNKLCDISFENLEDINIIESDYSPHYAIRRKTKQIIGYTKFKNKTTLKTIIKL